MHKILGVFFQNLIHLRLPWQKHLHVVMER